jgi:hypothetical protein
MIVYPNLEAVGREAVKEKNHETSKASHMRKSTRRCGPVSELVVVSNQQERTPPTNDAVSQSSFRLPFLVAKAPVLP